MSTHTKVDIRLASEALAARNARIDARATAVVNFLAAVLAAVAGALLLVHFGSAEGLW